MSRAISPTLLVACLALLGGTTGTLAPLRAAADEPRRESKTPAKEAAKEPGRDPRPSAALDEGPTPSERERRAVRGSPIEEAALAESPELREVRRFEEVAFPRRRDDLPAARAPEEGTLPQGLPGQWGGTGDSPGLRNPDGAGKPGAPPDSDWLRGLEMPEIPVRWEPQVLRFLEFFRNDQRGRAIMTSWLRRMGRYRALFERVLEREGVPRDLVYLAMIESGFEPGAVSRVGAGGVWQFMPAAARAYGLEVSYWVDGRRDPERAAEAAARYLKDLNVRFGSWHLAFAAYNAGYGAVLKSISRYNTNDFWELSRHEAGLPWETTLYVPKILAATIIGHNRAAFGFGHVVEDPPTAADRALAPPGTTLAAVARAAGAPLDVVAALNPELVRDRTPPDRGPIPVRIPAGTAAAYAAGIEAARAAVDRVETIVLRFGETLDDVARARGLSTKELRRLNGLRDSAELRGGATVVVPTREPVAAKPAAADPAGEDEATLVAVPDRPFSYEGRERVFYRTRDGDTLEEIASAFGVALDEVVEWNSLDPTARLHPKMILQLFVAKDLDTSAIALLDPAKLKVVTLGSEEFLALEAARRGKTRLFYTAKSGDTLAKIARRYGLQPADLARINRLSWSSELSDGMRIVVYSPTPELPREIVAGRAAAQKRPGKVDAAQPGLARRKVGVSGSTTGTSAGASKPGAPAAGTKGPARPALKTAAVAPKPASVPGTKGKPDAKAPAKPVPGRPAAPAPGAARPGKPVARQ